MRIILIFSARPSAPPRRRPPHVGPESALPRQGIEGLYAEHHGWLRGWLRGRLGNAFDAADLAHDTYLRILSSGRMPEPQQSRQHLAQIAKDW